MERRFADTSVSVETRAGETKPTKIVGYAAKFYRENDPGTEYQLFPGLAERIGETAFTRAIEERDDVRALFNHDPRSILGRLPAGTLKLSVDDVGLRYEIDPPDTQAGRDAITSIQRGDVDGSSFAFTVKRASWVEEEDRDVRVLDDVQLYDVGPVTYPAYESATTGVRSAEDSAEIIAEWEAWKDRKSRNKQHREHVQKVLENLNRSENHES